MRLRADIVRALALVAFAWLSLPRLGLAQALFGVELHWQGPSGCAEASGVLESARGLLGHDADPASPLVVEAQVRDAEGGGFSIALRAQRGDTVTRRDVTMRSCDDARQMSALFIALAIDSTLSTSAPASSPDVEPTMPAPAPAPAPAPPKPEAAGSQSVRSADDVERSPEAAAQRTSARGLGPMLGVAAGTELPAASRVSGLFAARLGFRWDGLRIELAVDAWLPSRGRVDGVDVAIERFGGAAVACPLLSFAPWELGVCLGFELSRVHAELNGADAGSSAWARASLGGRLGLWLTRALLLELSADPALALNRPRFASDSADTARAPATSFVSSVGISYAFGTPSPVTMD